MERTRVATLNNQRPTPGGAREPSPAGADPLRVMQVVTYLGRGGGTEQVVMSVMGGLKRRGFEHRICIMRGVDPDPASLPLTENNFVVLGSRDARSQFLLFRLAQVMKSYRPHIVHSRNWGTIEAVLAARLARVPITIHSEHGYNVEMLQGMPLRRRLLRRALYPMADALFTVTEELRVFHARQAWVSPERFRVIHNGVDTQRFSPRPEARPRLREELGLPPDSFVVGTVGRMVPIKDQLTILRAAEVLSGRGIDTRVLLVGWGAEKARLQHYIDSSAALAGRVVLGDRFGNIPNMLNAMDVFVLASLREGMSNTLLEAMASGLPVLATRVGGNPEVVEEGRSGWLFSPGDVEALSEHLYQLAVHSAVRCRLGAAARQRAVERFSLERMLQEYENLYHELARRRGVPGTE